MRIRRVEAGHAFDRRLEMIEAAFLHQRGEFGAEARGACRFVDDQAAAGLFHRRLDQIGRASCRERVCQYVYISVVAVSLKKKHTQNANTPATSTTHITNK